VIHAANVGDRVAEHLLWNIDWNIDFPTSVEIENRHSGSSQYVRESKFQRIIPDCATLNPHDVSTFAFRLRVPVGTAEIRIDAGVSASEMMDSVTRLVVNVRRLKST
jgi:hypothetical protein